MNFVNVTNITIVIKGFSDTGVLENLIAFARNHLIPLDLIPKRLIPSMYRIESDSDFDIFVHMDDSSSQMFSLYNRKREYIYDIIDILTPLVPSEVLDFAIHNTNTSIDPMNMDIFLTHFTDRKEVNDGLITYYKTYKSPQKELVRLISYLLNSIEYTGSIIDEPCILRINIGNAENVIMIK